MRDRLGLRRRAPEPALCPGCGAIYVKKRWSRSAAARAKARQPGAPLTIRICPACRRGRAGSPHGFLHVDGEFFPSHRQDLENLLHHEAEAAGADNPLHQILGWEELGDGNLLITTSTDRLAQRLGRALEQAYDGEAHYGFSHQNRLAHVWWHR